MTRGEWFAVLDSELVTPNQRSGTFGGTVTDQLVNDAQAITEWCKRNGVSEFSEGDLYRGIQSDARRALAFADKPTRANALVLLRTLERQAREAAEPSKEPTR